MRNKAINALLELGIPANTKGFLYITDAMETIDKNKGLQYKTYQLYEEIAKRYEGVTASKVERAIRHAFSEVTTYKNIEAVEKMAYAVWKNEQRELISNLIYQIKQGGRVNV